MNRLLLVLTLPGISDISCVIFFFRSAIPCVGHAHAPVQHRFGVQPLDKADTGHSMQRGTVSNVSAKSIAAFIHSLTAPTLHFSPHMFSAEINMQCTCPHNHHFLLPPTAFLLHKEELKTERGPCVVTIDTSNCCIWQITGHSTESKATLSNSLY